MRFLITRTSDNKKQPCECAVLKKYDVIERYLKTEEEFNKNKSSNTPLWKDYGIDHTTFKKNGKTGIQRKLLNHMETWTIEINTIEELIRFIDSVNNEIVITKCDDNEIFPTRPIYQIEIYDDWRE